jgi:hypothetical protein
MLDFKTRFATKEKEEDPFDLEVRFTEDERPATIYDSTYPAVTC